MNVPFSCHSAEATQQYREGAECGKIHVWFSYFVVFLFVFDFQEAFFGWKKSPLLITPLQEWSSGLLFSREGQCFNWNFVSAETTLHFFVVYFFWRGKAFRLLYRGLQINPIIYSKNLVTNQHQLEPSRSI